jgi:hypothetical protein
MTINPEAQANARTTAFRTEPFIALMNAPLYLVSNDDPRIVS